MSRCAKYAFFAFLINLTHVFLFFILLSIYISLTFVKTIFCFRPEHSCFPYILIIIKGHCLITWVKTKNAIRMIPSCSGLSTGPNSCIFGVFCNACYSVMSIGGGGGGLYTTKTKKYKLEILRGNIIRFRYVKFLDVL